MKNQIKIPWENFVQTAIVGYKQLYPNSSADLSSIQFVKERHGEGEGSLAELPDYVYLDINPS